jgi:hypothetical protein
MSGQRPRSVVAALIATFAFAGLAVQSAAAATPAPVEGASASSLPADGQGDDNFNLLASACGTVSCVSVGDYEFFNRSGGPPYSQDHALIVPSTNGVAAAAVASPLPSDTALASDPYETDGFDAVSCWSAGSCVAVGNYTDSSDHGQALVVPITNGVPGTPSEVTLPGDVAPNPQANLQSVSCSASGACVAVGSYDNNNNTRPDTSALVVDISNGVPAAGVQVPAPTSADPVQNAALNGVSCQSGGNCAAVGYYYHNAGDSLFAAMTVPITGGVPAAASEVTAMPPNSTGEDWYMNQISCPPSGTCSAIGGYNDDTSARNFVVPITNGVSGQGVETPPPSDTTSTESNIVALSCQSNGQCLAVGEYHASSGAYLAIAVPISNGVPSASLVAPLPSGADATGAQNAELQGLSCPTSGPCLASGYYKDAATGDYFGMTASFNAGILASAIQAPAPSVLTSSANLETVGCAALSCVATGDYGTAGQDEPYVVSAQAPLVIAPTTLPAGAVGTAYSQALSVMGAWGVYGSWSLKSGSLPAGLSLNAQTGVISGSPTAGGTSTFTVQVSATTGLPLQTATQSYSVSITAPPAVVAGTPAISLGTHTAMVSKNRFGLKLTCSVAPCSGTTKLQITELVTVRHGKKKVKKHLTVVIASASFSLVAGQTKTLTVTLNAAGRRALTKSHRLSATVLDTLSGVKRTLGHLTLKAAPTKKKKH